MAGPALIAASVAVAGLLLGGRGFLGGDPAVYAAQAWGGDLASRPVHLGYLAVANLLAPIAGEALPRWLDAVSALAAAVVVVAVGRTGPAALVAAAVVLPRAPFAEVDLPWIALLAAALRAPTLAAAALVGLAVSVSPVALLALPWWVVTRRERSREASWALGPLAGALLAVVGLTLVSDGAWWVGDRGVLTAGALLPGRSAEAWLTGIPWLALLLYRGGAWPLVAALPLLLAPPDVPTWIVPGLAIAWGARGGVLPALAQLAVSVALVARLADAVASEDHLLRRVAAELGPDDGVVARWSDGARVAVHATGDPYGVTWRSADAAVRDQAQRWCAARPSRVAVIEDGAVRWEPGAPWHVRFGCGRDTSGP